MTIASLITWLIPLPPILAFFLIVLLTNRNRLLSTIIAVGAAFLSGLGSMFVFGQARITEHLTENPIGFNIPWLATGESYLRVGVLVDPLTAIALFFVAWTVLMIFIYSVGYQNYGQPKGDHDQKGLPPHGATVVEHGRKHQVMSIEPMYSRFFAFIGLFAFGMYTLVVSDNLLTLFVGWEIMGLCSYLLIGFWYAKPSARAAMVKAFITTRVGDVFMLVGIAYLYASTGTLNFRELFFDGGENLSLLVNSVSPILGLSAAGLIGILLFIGTIGKSAQFPLHVWLPDAMEGPTPVSAMIHAAAMVSAGVYAMIRIFPLLSAGMESGSFTPPMMVMAIIGSVTALFAATIAVAQNDIKRVLAYSTISQLGYMIAALGIGAYVAATFHLVTHAFFKALLFLGSGSVIHGVEHGVLHTGEHVDPQDMFNMGGLRKKMPVTFWTFLIGGFALAGFPLITAGFWSKDEILTEAWHEAPIVFVVLALAALMTAFYTMRQIRLTFLGEPRSEAARNARETPWTMTLPLVVLAFFSLTFGWVGIPEYFPVLGGVPKALGFTPNWFHEFVGSSLPGGHGEATPTGEEHGANTPSINAHNASPTRLAGEEETGFDYFPLATSVVVSLGGLGLGWWYYGQVTSQEKDKFQIPLLKNKWYIDEIYEATFIRFSTWLSEVFTPFLDLKIIDGILHGVASVVPVIGSFLRKWIDNLIVNGFGDLLGFGTNRFGKEMKVIQTGKVQQYLVVALLFAALTMAYFVFLR
jgi:NADH-quinone oxidoreductase subunit L